MEPKKLLPLFLGLLFPLVASAQDLMPVQYGSSVLKYDSNTQCSFRNPSVVTFQGNSGGMTLIGGTGSGDDLTLSSTNNGTKGTVFFGSTPSAAYDEVNGRFGIGDTTPDTYFAVSETALPPTIVNSAGATLHPMEYHLLSQSPPTLTSAIAGEFDNLVTFNATNGSSLHAGVRGDLTIAGTGAMTTPLAFYGGIFNAGYTGSVTSTKLVGARLGASSDSSTVTNISALRGADAVVSHSGSGTLSSGTGVSISITNNNASGAFTTAKGIDISIAKTAGAGNITDGIGIDLSSASNPTNLTGIRIDGTGGSTTYGVYQKNSSTLNKFVGKTTVGADADPTAWLDIDGAGDDEQLHVKGHSTQTSNIILVEKDDGTDLETLDNSGNDTNLGNKIIGGGSSASELRLLEASGSGSEYTGFKAPPLAANLIYELPAADGSSGQVLQTNGSKVLSWATAGSGVTGIAGDSGGTATGPTVTIAGGTGITTSRSSNTVTISASGAAPVTKWNTSTTTYTSNVTLGDVAGLTGFSLTASKTYLIDGVLIATCGSGTPDVNVGFNFSSAPTNMNIGYESGSDEGRVTANNTNSGVISIVSSTATAAVFRGTFKASASGGTLAVRASQNTSNINTVTIELGSYASITQLD